jgi:RNA polymerase-binding transcription factor DksA
MPDIADKASQQQEPHLDAAIASRVQYGVWDKKPRDCTVCGDSIPEERLKAVNARLCVHCKASE